MRVRTDCDGIGGIHNHRSRIARYGVDSPIENLNGHRLAENRIDVHDINLYGLKQRIWGQYSR